MRPWLALSAFALAATARPAIADTVLDAATDIDVKLFVPRRDELAQSTDPDDYQQITDPDSTTKLRYLNQARCTCDKAAASETAPERQYVLLELVTNQRPTTTPTTELKLFAGESCGAENPATNGRAERCTLLRAFTVDDINDGRALDVFARVGDVLAPGLPGGMARDCVTNAESDAEITVLSNADGAKPFDEVGPEPIKISFDLTPPPVPTDLTPTGLERAIRVSWPTTTSERPNQYQALCIRDDGLPAHTLLDGSPEPLVEAKFITTSAVCGVAPAAPAAGTLADGTSPEGTLPEPLARLDKAYTCGQTSGDASSIDLPGLENGVPYWVVLVAVDTAGNYSAVYVPRVVIPKAVTDFWEDLNDERPEVDGGFCVSQVGRHGGAGSALVVLAALAVALRGRRRNRRRARGAGLVALAALAVAPTTARAQSWDPYWLEGGAGGSWEPPAPEWRLGLRVGPYHPAIDEKFDSAPGPFRRMFGPGYNLVPQLDLHRLWNPRGVQLGVGISGGYYRKTADVFDADSDPSDPARPRVAGATNTFQMIPLSVTGLARLTILDDRWGIPVVPYVRGGGAYNVWWVRTPTGELAMTDCDTCKDEALGASAGLVGAVGISIRGERLDPDSMASMRNGGVEHAGFYAELETSWVDGFGNEARLSLGDTTWYAGLDFEF